MHMCVKAQRTTKCVKKRKMRPGIRVVDEGFGWHVPCLAPGMFRYYHSLNQRICACGSEAEGARGGRLALCRANIALLEAGMRARSHHAAHA